MGLLDVEVGEVRVWKEGEGLGVRARRGPAHDFPRLVGLADEDALQDQDKLPSEPLIVENTRGFREDVVWSEGVRALAVFPLRVKERILGILGLATERGPRPFSAEELTLLRAVSDQVGLAVENARLQEEARQRAVVEERNRLARELHDSVAQTLYGATLYAEATARQLSAGDVTLAADHLSVLREMAQEALREMRLLVFELRPSILQQEGLAAALQARLEAVEGRGGLVTELNADGVGRLPLEVEEGVYRVVQEALNNVLKHSQARHVTVNLRWDASTMVLEIADDGIGFDPVEAREHGGLGLRGMEERAARMGGRLTIQSEAGAGTRVILEVRP
jgi:signal transduction histidine kinase